MTTSTRLLGHQLMTRLFTVEVPDEPAQLRAALAAQAALELHDPPTPDEALVAFQGYLGALAPIDVVVPFADALRVCLGDQPAGPRVLRDFPRLLSLIKATAVLRIAHRTRDGRGRLVATIDDYHAVHRLVAETYEASAGASNRIREAVTAVGELAVAKGPSATANVTELATWLHVSVPSAWRRVRDAIAAGWLVNDEVRRAQTAKLRLGEPMPATSSLPTPDALRELFHPVLVENAKTSTNSSPVSTPAKAVVTAHDATIDPARRTSEPGVFTFAPDPVVSQPTAQTEGEGGGPRSTVTAENVQTAELNARLPPPPVPLNFGIFLDDDEDWGMGTA